MTTRLTLAHIRHTFTIVTIVTGRAFATIAKLMILVHKGRTRGSILTHAMIAHGFLLVTLGALEALVTKANIIVDFIAHAFAIRSARSLQTRINGCLAMLAHMSHLAHALGA
jgi:hypothetical protein